MPITRKSFLEGYIGEEEEEGKRERGKMRC